jgi:TonB family protein
MLLPRLPALFVACGAFLALPAFAQDVIVGDLVWFSTAPQPPELPKARFRPSYPEELRKQDEIGYTVVSRLVDETGRSISLSARGTHPPFQRAVEQEYSNWSPPTARIDGKRVTVRVWLAVIFNPKSAAAAGPNATPRLLVAAPALTLVRPAPAAEPQVVRMKLSLDTAGAIVRSEPVAKISANLQKAVEEALTQWRFAPARQNGQPVAAELIVPVLCHGMRRDQGTFVPARIKQSVPTNYPAAMRRYGLSGNVVFDFQIDEEGRVRNPVIHESDSPAFDEPAMIAVRQYVYHPATRDGKPVASNVRVTIAFSHNGGDGGPFRVSGSTDQSKLPPELRYDTPVKVRGVVLPIYPYALRRDAVRGKAKAVMMINANGQVTDVQPLEAERPEFARALAAALQGFKFDPAYRDGKPVPHLLAFEQAFNPYDLPDEEGEDLLAVEKKSPAKIIPLSSLDVPLKPVSRRVPRFPLGLPADITQGDAVIECLIDKTGRVRLPRIKSATNEAFGYAAVQAASAWWFDPPLVNGKPVIVREEIPFHFSAKPPAPPPAKATKKKKAVQK